MSRSGIELLFVAATALLHVFWPQALSRGYFIVPAVIGWVAYIGFCASMDRERLAQWGLRRDGLRESSLVMALLLASGLPTLLLIGWIRGASYEWTVLISLLVYPLWGLVQHLLVQGMVTGPLAETFSRLSPRGPTLAVLISSVLFALLHVREPLLVPATGLLGLCFGATWLRWRNLWPLALAHGWLGAIVYPALIGRDPVAEILTGL